MKNKFTAKVEYYNRKMGWYYVSVPTKNVSLGSEIEISFETRARDGK